MLWYSRTEFFNSVQISSCVRKQFKRANQSRDATSLLTCDIAIAGKKLRKRVFQFQHDRAEDLAADGKIEVGMDGLQWNARGRM